MILRTISLVALLALAFAGGIDSLAWACKCKQPPDTKTALAGSPAVFVGKVTRVDEAGEHEYAVTFEVDQSWKGVTAKEVVVRTAKQSATCGYNFEMGKSYLVYCTASTEKELRTGICTRTRNLIEAKEDLADLGPGQKP